MRRIFAGAPDRRAAGTAAPAALAIAFLPALLLVLPACAGKPGTGTAPSGEPVTPPEPVSRPAGVHPGLDRLARVDFAPLAGKRVGVIANQTAVDERSRHLVDLLWESRNVRLLAIFSPEHGFRGAVDAGAAVGDSRDEKTGVPIFSLYGSRRKPPRSVLEGLDVLIYDIQDVGVRTYTYLSTLLLAMEAAAEVKIAVWVLDRPNPLGGELLEGPMLEKERESFVGPHPMPMRYGMTIGEFASMIQQERRIEVPLQVVRLEGWNRSAAPGTLIDAWIPPSPNIPTPQTALVYAGFVLLEGTNLSEGRGTARPFHFFGAPWLDAEAVAAALDARRLEGVRFHPVSFTPAASKYRGEACRGIDVQVVDPAAFRPVLAAVAAIGEVRRQHPDRFRFQAQTFDRLIGTARLREAIERGDDPRTIAAGWESELNAFRASRRPYLLYP